MPTCVHAGTRPLQAAAHVCSMVRRGLESPLVHQPIYTREGLERPATCHARSSIQVPGVANRAVSPGRGSAWRDVSRPVSGWETDLFPVPWKWGPSEAQPGHPFCAHFSGSGGRPSLGTRSVPTFPAQEGGRAMLSRGSCLHSWLGQGKGGREEGEGDRERRQRRAGDWKSADCRLGRWGGEPQQGAWCKPTLRFSLEITCMQADRKEQGAPLPRAPCRMSGRLALRSPAVNRDQLWALDCGLKEMVVVAERVSSQ